MKTTNWTCKDCGAKLPAYTDDEIREACGDTGLECPVCCSRNLTVVKPYTPGLTFVPDDEDHIYDVEGVRVHVNDQVVMRNDEGEVVHAWVCEVSPTHVRILGLPSRKYTNVPANVFLNRYVILTAAI
jgi:DNA-directed RNA polymerase subunit RPC12/RpoP